MITTLIAIRHGESEGNVDPSIYANKTNCDIGLTKRGHKQAEVIGVQIQMYAKFELPSICDPEDCCYYSSPYLRAVETTRIITKQLAPRSGHWNEELLLSEQCFGEAEGHDGLLSFINIRESEKRLYKTLGMLYYRPPRGDSLFDLYSRVGLFVQKSGWFGGHSLNIVVGHRASLVMMHAYLTGQMPEESLLAGSHPGYKNDWENGGARIYVIVPEERCARLRTTIRTRL